VVSTPIVVSEEMLYLPRRIWNLVVLVPLFVFIAALGVLILARGGGWVATLGGVGILLVLAGPLGLMVYANLEALKRRVPLARLDHEGIECSQGRLSWDDVLSIGVVDYLTGNGRFRYVFLALRRSVRPHPTETTYYHSEWQMSPKLTDWAVLLPLWTSSQAALSTLRRFYLGPVGEAIEIEGNETTAPSAAPL
jgi:hypothetical protein